MSEVCRKIEKIVIQKVYPYVAQVLKLREVPKNFNQTVYKMFSEEGISPGHDQFYYVVYLLIVPFLFVHNNIFEVIIFNNLFSYIIFLINDYINKTMKMMSLGLSSYCYGSPQYGIVSQM